jgi:hypothetical protein
MTAKNHKNTFWAALGAENALNDDLTDLSVDGGRF